MNENYYSSFKKIYQTSDSIEANEYLDLGWILLNVVKTQVAEESWSVYYVLGWSGKVEDIKRGKTFGERLKAEFKEQHGETLDDFLTTNSDNELF